MTAVARFSWPVWARGLRGLTPTESLVVVELARLADWRGVAVTSTAHLQDATGRCRRGVFGALRGLEEGRVVARERRRWGGRQACTWYRLQETACETVMPGVEGVVAAGGSASAGGRRADVVSEVGEVIGRQDNELLRWTLLAAVDEGWCGSASELLGATLEAAAGVQFAASIRRRVRYGRVSRDEARVDALSTAWELLREHATAIAGADAPWALLTGMVTRAMLSPEEGLPDGVRVVAADPVDLDAVEAGSVFGGGVCSGAVGYDDFGPVLVGLVESLLGAGMDETTAWAGTLRVAELSTRSPSRRHTLAGEDPRLAELGVSPEAARAWMTLLVGSRRGAAASVVVLDPSEREARARAVVRAVEDQAA